MKHVLDAWAVAALLQDEPAAARVEQLMLLPGAGISAVSLGEVYYVTVRRRGKQVATELIAGIRRVIAVEDPDWALVTAAGDVKARGGLSYPDAFCVATAKRHDAPLYTGDPEILRLADPDIEVIDLRSTT